MKEKLQYEQYAKAKIANSRNLVISACSKGGFTMAQQIEVNENGDPIYIFLKGAFHIDSISGLIAIRDALNETLQKLTIS